MKKQTLYIILSICIRCTTNLIAAETYKLTPQLQVGDQWKMQFSFNNEGFKFNLNPDELLAPMKGVSFSDSIKGLQIQSNWQMECLNSTDTSLQIKSTLLGFKAMEGNAGVFNYFDSFYPLSLSSEITAQIDSLVGKYCITNLNFKTDSVTMLTNTFNKEYSKIKLLSFMDKNKGSVLFNMTFTYDMYGLAGPDFLSVPLKIWAASIPSKQISKTSTWPVSSDSINEAYQLSIHEENDRMFTLSSGNANDGYIKIYKKCNLIAEMQLKDFIKSYTYDFRSQPNTVITGSFEDKGMEGVITFETRYPISTKKYSAEIIDGEFSLPINLAEASTFRMRYDGRWRLLFIEPGAKIQLTWNDKNRLKVSGNGIIDYNIFWDLDLYPHTISSTKSNKDQILNNLNRSRNRFEAYFNENKDSMSSIGKQFVKTSWQYSIAERFLITLENIEREKFNEKDAKILERMDDISRFMMQHLDSLPTIGNISRASGAYHAFLKENLILQQRLFLKDRGRRRDNRNIDENLLFARMQYVGYPQYYSMYALIEEQLMDGNLNGIDKQLADFTALSIAPEMSEKLEEIHQRMKLLDVGEFFPFGAIKDSLADATKLKEGEFTIVDIAHFVSREDQPEHILQAQELARITKKVPQIKKINYIAVIPEEYKDELEESQSTDSVKFTYVYLSRLEWLKLDQLQLKNGYRTFLLDKDGKILDNDTGPIVMPNSHGIDETITAYYNQGKQNQEAGISKKTILLILGFAILFGLISWGIITIRSQRIAKREAKKRQLKELELKAIRSQMNPHFIFNAMGSIQNLINQSKIKEANIYLASFAKLMRLVLNTSNKKLVSLSDEINLVKHYLNLEQLRVDFNYSISVNDKIVPDNEEISGMLIQPFVENAVIHGITPKGSGNILVDFKKEQQCLFCTISDDGIGIQPTNRPGGNGMALKLSQQRVDLLNSESKNKVNLEVINRSKKGSDQHGTIIKLTIPVQ